MQCRYMIPLKNTMTEQRDVEHMLYNIYKLIYI